MSDNTTHHNTTHLDYSKAINSIFKELMDRHSISANHLISALRLNLTENELNNLDSDSFDLHIDDFRKMANFFNIDFDKMFDTICLECHNINSVTVKDIINDIKK